MSSLHIGHTTTIEHGSRSSPTERGLEDVFTIIALGIALTFLAGALAGAEVQDRLPEEQRRRLANHRRAVSSMTRQSHGSD